MTEVTSCARMSSNKQQHHQLKKKNSTNLCSHLASPLCPGEAPLLLAVTEPLYSGFCTHCFCLSPQITDALCVAKFHGPDSAVILPKPLGLLVPWTSLKTFLPSAVRSTLDLLENLSSLSCQDSAVSWFSSHWGPA